MNKVFSLLLHVGLSLHVCGLCVCPTPVILLSVRSLSQLEVPGLSSASMMEVGPVGLSFELPKYTCTGLQIRFLRLTPVQAGSSQRWVRYVTHSDSYTIRI